MKKLAIIVSFTLFCGITGCGQKNTNNISTTCITLEEDNIEQDIPSDTEKVQMEEKNDFDTIVSSGKQIVKVYYPDENVEKLIFEEVECESVNEDVLWALIQKTGIITSDSKIKNIQIEDGKINLDLNRDFGDYIRKMGTAGEHMIIGSIVNTFLEAYECKEIKITEEGKVLTTGHSVYTTYMEKYE